MNSFVFFDRKAVRKQGSVLLLTLLVVSLLMVVVMAFTVYVRLSLRDVVQHQQRLEARAAARLGMNLALGQLQHVAGPDQRVTARGELLDGSGTYRPGVASATEHSMWTGVWDSSSFDETDPTAKPFLGWLVSSEDPAGLLQLQPPGLPAASAVSSSTPSARVTVVGGGSAAPGQEVSVEKVGLTTGRAFAWWVGG